MTNSKLYRNRKQNFQVLKPNVNCVGLTLAAGFSTPQVYNVNWVVPPAWYILQKWWGHVPPSSYGGAALAHIYYLPLLKMIFYSYTDYDVDRLKVSHYLTCVRWQVTL